MAKSGADDLVKNAVEKDGIKIVSAVLEDVDIDAMRTMGDNIKSQIGDGAAVLA